MFALHVAGETIRIFSDVHYGDRASLVGDLGQLAPLLAETDRLVLNGDTLDTRAGPRPHHTAACRKAVLALAQSSTAPITFLTGNHDPDFSSHHWLDLAGGEVFVIHGDALFEDIVPWGRDAREIRRMISAELESLGGIESPSVSLTNRMAIWRRAAAAVPQRHQSERNPLKYALRFALDTVWPPTKSLAIFRAWQSEPMRAAALARRERPQARFVLLGHTHRPAIRRVAGGPIVINTGSFTRPFGGFVVEIVPGVLRVRRINLTRGQFNRGKLVAEFPLANHG